MKFLEHLLNFILNVYLEFIHEASKKSQPSELELILLIFGGPFHRMEPLNFCSNFLMRSASFYHLKTVNTTIFRVKKSVLYSKYMIHSYVSNIFLNKKWIKLPIMQFYENQLFRKFQYCLRIMVVEFYWRWLLRIYKAYKAFITFCKQLFFSF